MPVLPVELSVRHNCYDMMLSVVTFVLSVVNVVLSAVTIVPPVITVMLPVVIDLLSALFLMFFISKFVCFLCVDHADQLIAAVQRHFKCSRWYVTVWMKLVEIMHMHVYTVLRMKDPTVKTTIIRFHVVMGLAELANSLDPPVPRHANLVGNKDDKEKFQVYSHCAAIDSLHNF